MNNPQQPPSQQTNSPSPPSNPHNNGDDAPLTLFAKRQKIYPKKALGRYRRLKWLVMALTLAVYYLAPLLRWDRGANAPDQAILIDLPSRRAYWFFIEIWPQEVYYLAAILIFAAIALFFVTSLLGRVWCGYFCPQTVWTDLFITVENIVQGDRVARQRLDKMPLGFEKIWKKGLTHFLWLLIGLSTGGAFVFYFNDAPALWADILAFQVSPVVMGFVGFLTFSTYLMAGFAREQVCIYMCPYSRFQSAMFDKDTLIIGYDEHRGEPRGKHKAGTSWEGRGHCIDCTACVQVCPMGIDIRKGLQMECIACGLCVDACNEIMDKVGLPQGLIRYDTERRIESKCSADKTKLQILRPRTFYYAFVLCVVAGLVLFGLVTRKPFELHVLHNRNPLFVTLSDGRVRNGYDIHVLNKTHNDVVYVLTLEGLDNAEMEIRGAGDLSPEALKVPADNVQAFHLFVSAAPKEGEASQDVHFTLRDSTTGREERYESMFIGKEK
jgi:cytochrome c oxidase accessory protein FixG